MSQAEPVGRTRSIRVAGSLAILYGLLGVFAGVSGAATFIPYRLENHQTLETAVVVTAVSAIGAVLSMVGIVSGWRLLQGRAWARRANLGVALGCVATVAAFAVATPPSTPSPVPGGPSADVFLAVVAAAYGLEILLLLLRRRPERAETTAAARGV